MSGKVQTEQESMELGQGREPMELGVKLVEQEPWIRGKGGGTETVVTRFAGTGIRIRISGTMAECQQNWRLLYEL